MKRAAPIWYTFTVLALASGCKKEEGSPGHPFPGYFTHPLSAWHAAKAQMATDTFWVDAATGGTLELGGHAKIVFDPVAFASSGGPVFGVVRVRVLRVLDAADMVLVDKTSIGDNSGTRQLLKSGGELKITADLNNVEVGIVPNRATVLLPGSEPDAGMRTCYSTQVASYTSDLIWATSDDTAHVVPDSILEAFGEGDWFYYTFTINTLGWVGCGTFQPGATAAFNITTPPGIDYNNADVWVVVPAYNTAVRRSGLVGGTFHHFDDLPIGVDAVIVSLAEVEEGQYYSSFTNITIAAGLAPSLPYQATTLAQFEAALRAL
ncbi:MAG: hypothetical protein WAU70_06915 [Flavobacteriales bacterium]